MKMTWFGCTSSQKQHNEIFVAALDRLQLIPDLRRLSPVAE